MKEALLYDKIEEDNVKCRLCGHLCKIKPGRKGICKVRENVDGTLFTLVYDRVCSKNVDPIEKKPLFHFLPNTRTYSIATVGCNFKCLFCQNADIAQFPETQDRIVGEQTTPQEVVQMARLSGSDSISYTYTEPTIFFELAFESAKLAHEVGLKNIFVTNGFMTADALEYFHPFLDAANVDLKSFRDEFYKKNCKARLQPVLDSIKKMKELGIWLEVTTLLIPGLNDTDEELRDIADFIAQVGVEIPWHVSRFHPAHKMTDRPRTRIEDIRRALDIGKAAGLRYVYPGNAPGDPREKTVCYECGEVLFDRFGFAVSRSDLDGDRCPKCGAVQDGVWG